MFTLLLIQFLFANWDPDIKEQELKNCVLTGISENKADIKDFAPSLKEQFTFLDDESMDFCKCVISVTESLVKVPTKDNLDSHFKKIKNDNTLKIKYKPCKYYNPKNSIIVKLTPHF